MDEITEENVRDIIDQDEYLLFYFTAKWCGPCQKIKPMILKLKEGLQTDNVKFYMIDIDSNEEFCDKCNIRSVPTFFIMNGKDLLGSLSGTDKTKLSEMIVNVFNEYNKKLKILEMKNKDIKE